MREHIYHWIVIVMVISEIGKAFIHFRKKMPVWVADTILSLTVVLPVVFYSVEAWRDLSLI